MYKGFMYLTAIIDVYSRFIVGRGLHDSLHGENVIEVPDRTIQEYGVPEIINSDQGSQFSSPGWVNKLNDLKIGISMDGRSRATDNIYIERFCRTLKQDYIYLFPTENGTTLWKGIKWFMNYYNKKRPHRGIGRRTPESIFRSGSQFTCEDWISYLESESIKISMDGKGRVIDNAFIERFWKSVKYDYVYLHPAGDGLELHQGLKEYIQYYNYELRHPGD